MSTTVEEFTPDDLLAMPDDGRRYELLEGKIVMSPAASLLHGKLARAVRRVLEQAAPEGLEVVENVGVRLDDRSVPGPDVIVYREPPQPDTWLPASCVQLAVEVSLSTKHIDLAAKLDAYGSAGIRHYWVVRMQSGNAMVDIWNLQETGLVKQRTIATHTSLTEPFPVELDPGLWLT